MTSITERNAQALIERNGTTLPKTKAAPRKAVAKGNKAVAEGNQPEAKAAPTPVKCHCGCGAEANIGRTYRPGHDARHAGQVARAVIEAPIGQAREAATEAKNALPPKLRAKADRMIANAAAKEEKRAAAARIRENARQALKAELAAL